MTTKNPLTEVREHLVAALHADLVGPFLPPTEDGEEAEEVLRLPPSRPSLETGIGPKLLSELGLSEEPTPRG